VYRAVGYFIYKYGRIDRLETLDDRLLELEAKIRSDFNMCGIQTDYVPNVLHSSRMKFYFNKGGVRTARFHVLSSKQAAKAFIREIGYPIVAKPDVVNDIAKAIKLLSDRDFDVFYERKRPSVSYLLEEWPSGSVYTYDGYIDYKGEVVFANSFLFEHVLSTFVDSDEHVSYICLDEIPVNVERAGKKSLKAFGLRESFFHLKFFHSTKDEQVYALELHLRPPDNWMTTSILQSFNRDVYYEWAKALVTRRNKDCLKPKAFYFSGFANRYSRKLYMHSHEEILESYPNNLLHEQVEATSNWLPGSYVYHYQSSSLDDIRRFIAFVQEETVCYSI